MSQQLSSLSRLIRRRMTDNGIDTQAELARLSGLSTQDINRFFGGGTKLPGPEKRRSLARALRVSHLDLLIAAGEINENEIEPLGVQGVVDPDPVRAMLLDKLRRVRLDDPAVVVGLEGILNLFLPASDDLIEHGDRVGDAGSVR